MPERVTREALGHSRPAGGFTEASAGRTEGHAFEPMMGLGGLDDEDVNPGDPMPLSAQETRRTDGERPGELEGRRRRRAMEGRREGKIRIRLDYRAGHT